MAMLPFVNSFMSWYLKRRIPAMEHAFSNPAEVQHQAFTDLLAQVKKTTFGKDFGLQSVKTIEDYRSRVPIHHYDDLKPYINRLMRGEQGVLWPEEINWFAKSSGTTSDKSKYIPVSYDALEYCQFRGSRDVLAWYYYNKPDARVFQGKGLIIGGSHRVNELSSNSYYGDLSAVLINNLPFIANQLATPELDVALMENWEQKLQKIIETTQEENVTNISGVPTWTLLVIKGLLEKTGKKNLLEVWPKLELYVHGGVSFDPFRKQFEKLISGKQMNYRETYNASEGFFGVQDSDGLPMSLMLDYGIFYEFVPLEELEMDNPTTKWIDDVELETNYAVILNTNSGLWRYVLGDTIKFVSKNPYRFVITGRTKCYINTFGEELMVENAEKAITLAQERCQCVVEEYTAAPLQLEDGRLGRHQWAIAFSKAPDNLENFTKILDQALMEVNSDYEAKRQGDLALLLPEVISCKPNTFYNWLKKRDKLGGQNKVPKLSNNRKIIEEVIAINNEN
jgi:hypothetical protein